MKLIVKVRSDKVMDTVEKITAVLNGKYDSRASDVAGDIEE